MKRELAQSFARIGGKLPFMDKALLKLGSNYATIFMLHRFDMGQYGDPRPNGHKLDFLESSLLALLKSGHNIVTLDEIVMAFIEGRKLPNAVAFTIDDGFYDHGVVAESIFAKLGVPVTIFLVTGFVDKKCWCADSKLEFLCDSIKEHAPAFTHNGMCFEGLNRKQLRRELVWYAKTLPLDQVDRLIAHVSKVLEVELPEDAPHKYRAMTWDEVRRLEALGVSFGAHTVNHPTLSIESDRSAMFEIEESTKRLKQEIKNPSKVFCYPTGRSQDFSARDQEIVSSLGYLGAVSTKTGYLKMNSRSANLNSIHRFGWPGNSFDLNQILYSVELIKSVLARNSK
jgi:peptidoglycan/xylan/chitin deacetylase (PgdA/CDA1 family)